MSVLLIDKCILTHCNTTGNSWCYISRSAVFTITDGNIIPFILYANIVSINNIIFFPQNSSNHPAYVFISLANLDLGISTCFYDGMDDYAKMWLQLLYPGYLICIAATLIVASHYLPKVQQLTAQRALPVLVTLFLLSYTKILRMVCSVLFSYTKLTQLPSLRTTIVWSVDANVTLFGTKFIVLFILCIMMFLILIPFTVILTCTRILSRFNFIHYFKPLLDAYQGPYKTEFCYWPGLQIVIRTVFFGLSALEKDFNLTIGIAVLVAIGYFQALFGVYKSKYKNYNELLILLNIVALFSVHTQNKSSVIFINILIMFAVLQFSLIIAYHIVYFPFHGWIISKLQPWIDKCQEWYQSRRNVGSSIMLHYINAPEVTHNYTELREPLAGCDN